MRCFIAFAVVTASLSGARDEAMMTNEEDELREETHDSKISEEALVEMSEGSSVTAEIQSLEAKMAEQVKAIAETHAEIAKVKAEIPAVVGRGYRDSAKSKMLADMRQKERDGEVNERYHGKKNETIQTCNADQQRFDSSISTPGVCSTRDVCQLMVIMDAHQVRKTTVGPAKFRLPGDQGIYYSPYKLKYSMLKAKDGMKRSTSCSFGQMKWLYKKALYDSGKSECGRILNDHSSNWYKANRMLLNAIANYWCPAVWTEQLAQKDHCEVKRNGRQVKYGLTMEGCAQIQDQTLEEFMGGSLFKTGPEDTGAAPGWSLAEESAEATESVDTKIDELIGEISKIPERSADLDMLQEQLVHAKSHLE